MFPIQNLKGKQKRKKEKNGHRSVNKHISQSLTLKYG